MELISKRIFVGERAMFGAKNVKFELCDFKDGESPLKHGKNLELEKTNFGWKYPLWYTQNIVLNECELNENARAGIWYGENLTLRNCLIKAPKTFRKSRELTLTGVSIPDAAETMWNCADVNLKNVNVKGDYFAMNCENLTACDIEIDGNYCFDGAQNIKIANSKLISKDAFWNSRNVTVEDSFVSGEYIGWNSKNLTLINCEIDSLQGFCYCENLLLVDCELKNTNLAFEYSSVNLRIKGAVKSVKNPQSGEMICDEIGEIIMESDKIDPKLTKILQRKNR